MAHGVVHSLEVIQVVVDDDQVMRMLACEVLVDANFEFIEAETGARLICLVASNLQSSGCP